MTRRFGIVPSNELVPGIFAPRPADRVSGLVVPSFGGYLNASGILANPTIIGSSLANPSVASGLVRYFYTGATGASAAGFTYAGAYSRRDFNPLLVVRFYLGALYPLTNMRFWVGLSQSACPLGDDPPTIGCGLRFSTSVPDTNFMFWRNDELASTGTFTDTGIAAVAGEAHTFWARLDDAGGAVTLGLDAVSATYTTDVPSATAALRPSITMVELAAAVKDFVFHMMYMEQDK